MPIRCQMSLLKGLRHSAIRSVFGPVPVPLLRRLTLMAGELKVNA
jgi:hypothetical protein